MAKPVELRPRVMGVFRVERETSWSIRTLAETYKGTWTHFLSKGGSCICGRDKCPLCRKGEKQIWKGYTPIEVYLQSEKLWIPQVLEVTEGLDDDFWGLFKRGQVWQVFRPLGKKGKREKVQAVLLEDCDPNTFPPAFPILTTLERMYHVDEIVLDLTNPMPRRAIVDPSLGPPPPPLPGQVVEESKPVSDEQKNRLRELLNNKFQSNGAKR